MATIWMERPASPARGDFMIFSVDDSAGRGNRTSAHTNYGYSGYIVLVVWDGKHWARATKKFERQIGLTRTTFAFRYDEPTIREHAIACVERYIAEHPGYTVKSWWWEGTKYGNLVPA